MHSARSPISQRSGLLLVIVWLLALWPRVSSPHAFISVDEAYHWFDRVKRFHEALQQGDFAATNLIGHPGVTTLWLGAAGRSIYQTLVSAGWFDPTDVGVQWVWLRLPIALITALCVVLAYPCSVVWPVAEPPCWLCCSGPPTPFWSPLVELCMLMHCSHRL
ncbi:MAG: hypothetical protein HC837_01575 [Chloroflexaceae bacterium]|nr:hypothetical protein [Chloroflexaceae bacterium]